MAKAASLLALGLLMVGCGGVASTPNPRVAASNGASEGGTAPSPGAPTSLQAGSVTVGNALLSGACPACFGAEGLPALSDDGRIIATLQPEPFVALGAGAWPHTAWSFVLVEAETGNILETVSLFTQEDVMHREYTPLNCCDDAPVDEEGCNPDACAPDPRGRGYGERTDWCVGF